MVNCWKCGSGMKKETEAEFLAGVSLGKFEHFECKCGEKVFSLETTRKMEEIARRKGVWGLSSKAKFATWGKSIGLRIPAKVVGLLNIRPGESAEILPNLKEHELVIKVKEAA